MNFVKIGIVGVGNIGSAHLSCIYQNQVEGMAVKAVCDIDSGRLDTVKHNYPDIELYDNYNSMLEKADINAVLIATPHPFHCDMAQSALEKGMHILVEKPIDITVSKAKAINEYAIKSGKVFGIMFNQRTNGLFAKAREIVNSGELGELKRSVWIITNWYRTQSYYDSGSWRATWSGEGGGVLLNQAPHNLDIWQWICGMPKSVIAFCNVAKYHDIEVEDEATIYIEYENGATGVFITSTGEFPGTNRLEISGTKGKIVIENRVFKHWKLKTDEREICKTSKESFCNIEYDYSEYRIESESAHKGILQNFANAILHGEKLLAPGIEGINELTISNAAYLSQWGNNIRINLPFDNERFDMLLRERMMNSKLGIGGNNIISKTYNQRWQVQW